MDTKVADPLIFENQWRVEREWRWGVGFLRDLRDSTTMESQANPSLFNVEIQMYNAVNSAQVAQEDGGGERTLKVPGWGVVVFCIRWS